MRALVFEGVGRAAVRSVPDPSPREHEVVVSVAACGVCGTDRHIVEGNFAATAGVVLGHEIVGTVASVGSGVANVHPGDRVALNPNLPCHMCAACRRGDVHLCERLLNLGVVQNGGLADRVVAQAQQVHVLPSDLPFRTAVLAEPVSCCVHGIDVAAVRSGDRVLIYGLGPIGRILAALVRHAGASTVVGVDPSPPARDDVGALVDAAVDFVPDAITGALAAAGNASVDVVIEASGRPEALRDGLRRVRDGGTVLQFGVSHPDAEVAVRPYEIYRREIHLVGAFTNPFTMERALTALHTGVVPVDTVLGRPVSLDDVPSVLLGSAEAAGRKVWVRVDEGAVPA